MTQKTYNKKTSLPKIIRKAFIIMIYEYLQVEDYR